jgi:hypothetical protein
MHVFLHNFSLKLLQIYSAKEVLYCAVTCVALLCPTHHEEGLWYLTPSGPSAIDAAFGLLASDPLQRQVTISRLPSAAA